MKSQSCCDANEDTAKTRTRKTLSHFFDNLTKPEIRSLEELAINVNYSSGDLVFPEGMFADGFYIIGSGFLKYGRPCGPKGDKGRIFSLLGPGDGFGEEIFTDDQPANRFATARALTSLELTLLENGALLDFLHDHPKAFLPLANWLRKRITYLQNRMYIEACENTKERIKFLVLDLSTRYGGKNGNELHFPIRLDQKTLANLLGVSVESVSTALNSLQEEGTIEVKQESIAISAHSGAV